MALNRRVTVKAVPLAVAKDLVAQAAILAAAAGVDTAVAVSEGQTALASGALKEKIHFGISHIYAVSDAAATAAASKTAMDTALAASGLTPIPGGGYGPLLESNDADDAVTISRAAGATVIRFTATVVDPTTDAGGITFTLNKGGISDAAFLTPVFTPISDGVVDLSIDLQAGDSAGPYSVVVTATDRQGGVATVTTVVTSAA